MHNALNHFKKTDPKLYEIALKTKLNDPQKSGDYFIDLVELIISQQLSGKAADTIFARFKKLFPNEKITPIKLINISDQNIRSAGASYNKIKYIKGIAMEIINQKIELKTLEKLSDQDVTKELIRLKGVGAWTAEMFLMFSLNRPDVFSAGDLGIQNAIVKLYKLNNKPDKEKLLKISNIWSPFRTYACRVLWKSLDLE